MCRAAVLVCGAAVFLRGALCGAQDEQGALPFSVTLAAHEAGTKQTEGTAADANAVVGALLDRMQEHDYEGMWELMAPAERGRRGHYLLHAREAWDGWGLEVVEAPHVVAERDETALVRTTVQRAGADGTVLTLEWEVEVVYLPRGWRIVRAETVEPVMRPVRDADAAAAMVVVEATCQAWCRQRWEDLYQTLSPSVRPPTAEGFVEEAADWAKTAPQIIEVLSVKVPDIPVRVDPAGASRAGVSVDLRCWPREGRGTFDTRFQVFVEKLDGGWYVGAPNVTALPSWFRELKGPYKKMLAAEPVDADAQPPDEVVRRYLEAWADKRYREMYSLLNEAVRDSCGRTEALASALFRALMREYESEGGKVEAFERPVTESLQDGVAVVTADVTVKRPHPQGRLVSGARRFWLTVEEGQWRLANETGTEWR